MSASLMSIMVLSVAAVVLASVRRIPEGQVYSLRRVGGQIRIVGAGTHFLLPLIERVSHKISLTGTALPLEGALSSGESYRGALYFQVLDPARADVVIDSVDQLLRERSQVLLGSAELPTETAERRRWLKHTLNGEVRERGLLVTRVELHAAA